jgi:methyl acetate hydrolase
MALKLSRRDLMIGASSAVAAAALGGLADRYTLASEASSLARNPAFAAIDRSLRQAVDNETVAGVVAMAATPQGIVYEGSLGAGNRDVGLAMSSDAVFWLLSMTKGITAAACMQLIEQDKLRLDQLAAEILPELRSPQVLEGFDAAGQPRLRPAKRPITVRHLLTHTSGFTYSIWSENLLRYEKVTGMPAGL